MDLDQFIRTRRPHWNRLERLLDAAEQSPEWELGRERLQEIVKLYRQASSDLNHARSFTANPQVLDRLNALTGRGYRFVYRGTRRKTTRQAVKRFFLADVPAAFRKESTYVLVAGAALVLGAVVGFAATVIDPLTARDLTPQQFYNESPKERVDRIEGSSERVESIDEAAQLGAMLYTNNIQVSFLAFALGAFTIVGGVWYLFWTGTWLGAIAASYYLDGVHVFFAAWVGPHGALELPAIVFAGAAGLRTGRALLMPGDLSRAASLRQAFPSIWRMMLGTAAVLVVAGLIEGSFSQFSAKTVPYGVKIGVAAVLFVMLIVYLFVRRRSTEGEENA
ncbi:MAG: stage II sporulation protein M [Planctomycetota bacterium]|jgi:uncharacterized membrane protein SpoIIM required for sporulation